MASAVLICDGQGLTTEVLAEVNGSEVRHTWVEGVDAVERTLAAWAEREAEGYSVTYNLGTDEGGWGIDEQCPMPVDGVALMSLWGPGGARVASVAFDPGEFPGGAGYFTSRVVVGSTSLGGVSHWFQRRREDAARVFNAAADAVDSAGKAVGAAVGGALVATGDAVATLPTPREALNGIAEGVGGFAGTVVGAFGVAGAKGTGAAVSALWEELPVPGKVLVVLAGALAAFIGARALGRALK